MVSFQYLSSLTAKQKGDLHEEHKENLLRKENKQKPFLKQKGLQQVKSQNQICLTNLCAQAKKKGDFSKSLQAQRPNIDQIAGPSSRNIFLSLILDTIDSKCNKDRL